VRTRILKLRGDRGQALVELAFVLPLVLVLLFGIIDFGLAYNTKNSDTNLANLAARSVSVMGTATTTQSCGGTGQTSLLAWIDCVAKQDGESQPTTACLLDTSAGGYAAGDALKVEVQTPFNWFGVIGASGGIVGKATSTIGASATNRVEAAMTSGSTTNAFVTNSSTCSS
jgi:hypothetical protein